MIKLLWLSSVGMSYVVEPIRDELCVANLSRDELCEAELTSSGRAQVG